MKPARCIAAHRLWTPQGIVCNPVVTLSAEGRVLEVECCVEPDRLPATEFYSGVLVPDFPAEYAAAFAELQRRGGALAELLPTVVPACDGIAVVLSGLDYDRLQLTGRSRIEAV